MFYLWKDLKKCFLVGKEFNPNRKNLEEAYFAGLILIIEALKNLALILYPERDGVDDFMIKYLSLNKDQAVAIRVLRDGLIHNFYSLSHYHKGIKYYYGLAIKYDALITGPIPHPRGVIFLINPRKLFLKFEEALRIIIKDLLNHEMVELRGLFKKNTDRDSLILVTE